MFNWKVVGLSIALIGCTSVDTRFIEAPKMIYPLPEPVVPSGVTWRVITKETIKKEKDEVVFIGLSFDDNIRHRQWLESLKLYIEKQQAIICKHQPCEE